MWEILNYFSREYEHIHGKYKLFMDINELLTYEYSWTWTHELFVGNIQLYMATMDLVTVGKSR